MSRAHPGQSLIYKKKLETREARKFKREAFKKAKAEWFEQNIDKPINRSAIKKLACDILKKNHLKDTDL